MKIIADTLLDATTQQAKENARLRMNYNFHTDLNDPVNRLINAVEPDTYVRPHRHANPEKDEIFLVLRGKIGLFIFDDTGRIADKRIVSPASGVYGADIPAGIWHNIVSLESGTVIFEAKAGPFSPLTPVDVAPWSPDPARTEEVRRYLDGLTEALTGD